MPSSTKPIRLSHHALKQCTERGTDEVEVVHAIRNGWSEHAKNGRVFYRYNLPYGRHWQGKWYAIKQVAPVVAEEPDELVVITVYTFYF